MFTNAVVMQHVPSDGQVASASMSSQNSANSPLTHSPGQDFAFRFGVLVDMGTRTMAVVDAMGTGVVLTCIRVELFLALLGMTRFDGTLSP